MLDLFIKKVRENWKAHLCWVWPKFLGISIVQELWVFCHFAALQKINIQWKMPNFNSVWVYTCMLVCLNKLVLTFPTPSHFSCWQLLSMLSFKFSTFACWQLLTVLSFKFSTFACWQLLSVLSFKISTFACWQLLSVLSFKFSTCCSTATQRTTVFAVKMIQCTICYHIPCCMWKFYTYMYYPIVF